MFIQYSGVHSINFWKPPSNPNKRNSWRYYGLIPINRPFVENAEPEFKIISIPGTNKRLDLTDKISSKMIYKKRVGDWEFIIIHDMWDDWISAYNSMANYFHSKEVILSLEDDPDVYYEGTITVNTYKTEKEYSIITFHYELYPMALDVSDAIDRGINPEKEDTDNPNNPNNPDNPDNPNDPTNPVKPNPFDPEEEGEEDPSTVDPDNPYPTISDPKYGRYPIKFITADGQAYVNDYGISGLTTYLENNDTDLYAYDLIILNRNAQGEIV